MLLRLWRRWRWLWISLLGALLLALILLFSINAFVKHAAAAYLLSPEEAVALGDVDCILVLGCGLQNGAPGPMLSDRLDTSLQLYHAGASERLLMSGDHGRKEYNEVGSMKAYATAKGVPTEAIFTDHAGFSTYDSMYRARDVFCAKRLLIVTQDYHLYRALHIARSLGLEAFGVAAASPRYLGQAQRDGRELLARVKDFTLCLIQPAPTQLGEAIPVSGPASASDG